MHRVPTACDLFLLLVGAVDGWFLLGPWNERDAASFGEDVPSPNREDFKGRKGQFNS